ncbi:MAG: type IX secretion system outer membrane channel protein PorV [Bacteroidales bacterium]|nr:type IX secretion system outer membrane channel protein PorV [Bacteroidales bacterium]MCL2133214.1 type IX secretion system outer membrane channel protein PorV [Bacteroidales bacterium]
MKILVRLLPIIAFLLMLNEARPQTNEINIRTAMPLLGVTPDARASGMGDVGAATSPTTNDMAWNCAKYVFNEYEMGVSLSYIPWLRSIGSNINLVYMAGFYKLDDRQAIGASIRFFSLGSLKFLDPTAQPIRDANPYELTVDLSYSLRLGDFFSLGTAFRYLRSDLSGGNYSSETIMPMSPANGVAADVGFYYTQPVERGGLVSNLSAGLSITNIGTKMDYSNDQVNDRSLFLPTTLRLAGGMAMDFGYYHGLNLSLEFSKYLVPFDDAVSVPLGMVQSFYDSPDGFSGELKKIMIGVGGEYQYADLLNLRAGFYYDPKNPQHRYATLGFGLIYTMFTLDLSYLMPVVSGFSNPLANTIRVTLGVNIGELSRY